VPSANASKKDREDYAESTRGIGEFLERVYNEFRNLGLTPQERQLITQPQTPSMRRE